MRQVYQFFQPLDKVLARNGPRTKAGQMTGLLLAINKFEAVALELVDQRNQGNLGGIGLPREHGLAEKHASQCQTV